MNNKMTTNSKLAVTEPKPKTILSKQVKQKQNQKNGEHNGKGRGENVGKGTESK